MRIGYLTVNDALFHRSGDEMSLVGYNTHNMISLNSQWHPWLEHDGLSEIIRETVNRISTTDFIGL